MSWLAEYTAGGGEGKRWAAALAVAACAFEHPNTRIAVVSRDVASSRVDLQLIVRACNHLGIPTPFTCRTSRLSIGWQNGARVKFFHGDRPLDQCGESHHFAWFDDLRRNKDCMATLEAIAYGLKKSGGLGHIIETGQLRASQFPQLKDCEPRLLTAADELLDLNGAWGTAWTLRESDVEANQLTFRWENCRARVTLVPGVPYPLFCVSAPEKFLDTWIGEPRRHDQFAQHIQHYRWDGGGRRLIRPPLLEGKTVSECLAVAEEIAKRGNLSC